MRAAEHGRRIREIVDELSKLEKERPTFLQDGPVKIAKVPTKEAKQEWEKRQRALHEELRKMALEMIDN